VPGADFGAALERVVRALPRFMLGTMDSFFAKVVRAFQYELGVTGGRFQLLEGPQLAAARDGLLDSILGERLEHAGDDGFLHAFRRAMAGREEMKVAEALRSFVEDWQAVFRECGDAVWGPAALAGAGVTAWEEQKHIILDRLRNATGGVAFSDKRQPAALDKLLDALAAHTVGSGSLGTPSGLLASALEAVGTADTGPLELAFYKPFVLAGSAGEALREALLLLARCEWAAALGRTRAVREVMEIYDGLAARQLRRRGRLGFDDIKSLMGEWARGEDARLRREAVDFRLDERHEHWLLDEFQDTSRADWLGLQPLIDEAAAEGPGSLFVVGDTKQAIYAWRGGEVGLFEAVKHRYGGNLALEHIAESWRSCPEVLALVNRVGGDAAAMNALFAGAAGRWDWQEHFPAPPLAAPGRCGEARVEMLAGKWDERLARLIGLLGELEIGSRALSCGVLVRGNQQVREVADALREAGFEVVEEGRREPARDHPVGVMISQLLRWLADPANNFARETVAMSPLAAPLHQRCGGDWQAAWSDLTARVAAAGMAATIEELLATVWAAWSDFGRRRAGDLLAALAAMDAGGEVTLREAADQVARMEISQSPGVAAVQVMTIHKAKGLGFDVVVLPDIPTDAIPQAQYFKLAAADGWLSQAPLKWARRLLPALREAEDRWAEDQRYEALCLGYVALTRAKRGLYVLLEQPAASRDPDKPSLATWLEHALDAGSESGVVFQSGTREWLQSVPLLAATTPAAAAPERLGPAVARRERLRPSGTPGGGHSSPAPPASGGKAFGTAVHEMFERIGWLDDDTPPLPDSEAGRLVNGLLKQPELHALFRRHNEPVELFREQALDAIINGQWLSGVIDRLHLWRDAHGAVTRLELVDFKTDAVTGADELLERHRPQMDAYRAALALAYSGATIRCRLLSTRLRALVEVG
jgi:superfamily I DNA/RNA helicase